SGRLWSIDEGTLAYVGDIQGAERDGERTAQLIGKVQIQLGPTSNIPVGSLTEGRHRLTTVVSSVVPTRDQPDLLPRKRKSPVGGFRYEAGKIGILIAFQPKLGAIGENREIASPLPQRPQRMPDVELYTRHAGVARVERRRY